MFDLTGRRVWVAGHRGLVGSALLRRLACEPIGELITATSSEVDLRRQVETEEFVRRSRPQVAIVAAARVGGIEANRSAQAEFLYDNLMIAANVIEACRRAGLEKVLFLGSSCIYPRHAVQPMRENALLTGPLEPTNEGYAVAKIATLELSKMFRRQYGMNTISLMPTNLYGPGDNFDFRTSHVVPALIRKIHEAVDSGSEVVEVWGTGRSRREFLHVDDLADAIVFALGHYQGEAHLNVGTGTDVSIRELAELIAGGAGWEGRFSFDESMPDGTPRKLLDVSRLAELGWKSRIGLGDGVAATHRWVLANRGNPRTDAGS